MVTGKAGIKDEYRFFQAQLPGMQLLKRHKGSQIALDETVYRQQAVLLRKLQIQIFYPAPHVTGFSAGRRLCAA
jgi:hypothetical protein